MSRLYTLQCFNSAEAPTLNIYSFDYHCLLSNDSLQTAVVSTPLHVRVLGKFIL